MTSVEFGRMPAVFFGHGNPLLTLGRNRYTDTWRRFGQMVPRPHAVLCTSAHWYDRGLSLTVHAHPPTIHDFRGFPDELFAIRYPAPGDPQLAARVRELLSPLDVVLDEDRGLDHGAWAVLRHMFPDADVPVVQLSLDASRPAAFHYQLGQTLQPLREEGVLIVGSGNIVHNLQRMNRQDADVGAYPWAEQFAARVRDLLARRDHESLIDWPGLGEAAHLSVPTVEHYLPLLYVAGLQRADESSCFATDRIEHGSIGMLSMAIGIDFDFDVVVPSARR